MNKQEVEDCLLVSQSPKRQLPSIGAIAAILCAYTWPERSKSSPRC